MREEERISREEDEILCQCLVSFFDVWGRLRRNEEERDELTRPKWSHM